MINYPIYFDYAATTPVDPKVLEEMLPYFTELYGNPSSTHIQGSSAKKAVKNAQAQIADLISSEPEEIYFTSGSTESINLVIKGIFESSNKGKHIITVKTEHKAVLDTCSYLENLGAEVTYLDVDEYGLIDLKDLEKNIKGSTILVCVMHANNETGVLQDIKRIGQICRENNILFFSDITQSYGKVSFDVENMSVDMACFSGHKIYGPKGIGGLYIRNGIKPTMQIHGGGHQNNMRSGTLNVPGIVGLGKASEIAKQNLKDEFERLKNLQKHFESELLSKNKIKINGSIENRLPHILNIQLIGQEAEEFKIRNKQRISISTGSACNSEVIEPSHVLKTMGLNDREAGSSIRVSLGIPVNKENMKHLIQLIFE